MTQSSSGKFKVNLVKNAQVISARHRIALLNTLAYYPERKGAVEVKITSRWLDLPQTNRSVSFVTGQA